MHGLHELTPPHAALPHPKPRRLKTLSQKRFSFLEKNVCSARDHELSLQNYFLASAGFDCCVLGFDNLCSITGDSNDLSRTDYVARRGIHYVCHSSGSRNCVAVWHTVWHDSDQTAPRIPLSATTTGRFANLTVTVIVTASAALWTNSTALLTRMPTTSAVSLR